MDEATFDNAARRRVAIEMVARHERALRRTARRYSICVEDAEDAFQRSLEILLTKAPPGEARELVRWMQTVIKHEALAVRRGRERHLGSPRAVTEPDETVDWVALIPATGAGPAERAERREEIARSREALKTLKPAELRALTLLAQGYSYAEIGEITGWTRTKINRCLAEGRERFRAFISRSEAGARCAELRPVLSAFCDGEADPEQVPALREHLRACAHCRAAMRDYRAAPRVAGALLPAPLAARLLLGRAQEALGRLQARLPGQGRSGAEAAVSQAAAAGGTRGAGMAALAKVLAVCAGTAGGAAACVGAGVLPLPFEQAPAHRAPTRPAAARQVVSTPAPALPVAEPEPAEPPPSAEREPAHEQLSQPPAPEASPPAQTAGAVEYAPPAPAPEPEPEAVPPAPAPAPSTSSSTGSAAGEFGP